MMKPRAGWPDGRRKFGTVSAAILTVMALHDGEDLRLRDIHARVEKILAGPVSRYSVADYVLTNSKGPNATFARTRHGHYRLRC